MAKLEKFDSSTLQQLSNILSPYLTGGKITNLFARLGYNETSNMTKSFRICNYFIYSQNQFDCSNKVIEFILEVCNPVNFIDDYEKFLSLTHELNLALSFSGLKINEDGKISRTSKAQTIPEAKSKATHLRDILYQRNIHSDVLKFCKSELISENYFHAIFEATKSVADKIRSISECTLDGNTLIYTVFDKRKPLLAINSLQTPSEINEYNGFKNLLVGIFGMFRNTTAHEPKINWKVSEQDAIDLLTTLSFIHRKLDQAVKIPY